MTEKTELVIETERGDIEIEVYTSRAPITSSNFLRYVDEGFYTNGSFYRTVTPQNQPNNDVRIEVIQGGINKQFESRRFEPIPLERTTVTGLSHTDGTLSMSRLAADSAHSEIFICIGDQPELDFGGRRYADGQGFAAFGRVTKGMDVVRTIQQSPHEEQQLTPPTTIRTIRRK